MDILKATTDDIPRLCELLDHLFEQEVEFSPDKELQSKALKEILEDENIGEIFIAKAEDEIIGMVNLLYTVSTAYGGRVALLEDMVIDPGHRGKGIGSVLIEFAMDYLKDQGCHRITLLSDIENCKAHKFYVKKGFKSSLMVPYRKVL